jgi:hypothetical protein
MKLRMVSFFADANALDDIQQRIQETAFARFAGVSGFRGVLAIHSEGPRPEIIAMSFWDDDLEASEQISEEFREEIEGVTGRAPSRKTYVVDLARLPGNTPGDYTDLL